jgi:hypothetical protein
MGSGRALTFSFTCELSRSDLDPDTAGDVAC